MPSIPSVWITAPAPCARFWSSTTGEEVAAHVYDYPHGAAGVVISDRDPNLARQHPRDYETGAEAAVKGVLKEGARKERRKARRDHRHWRRHYRQHTAAGRFTRRAAGLRQAVRKRSERTGVAVERSHLACRGGADHSVGGENASGVSGENRQPLFVGMVLGEDSALCARRAGRLRRGGHLGRNRRLDSGHAVRHAQTVASETRRVRGRAQSILSTPTGADIPTWSF